MSKLSTTVKWFDAKKGYGFLDHPDGGDDVFVHYTQIESDQDFKTLRTGQQVEFEMNDGPKGLHALDVVPQEDEEDASASSWGDDAPSHDLSREVPSHAPPASDEDPPADESAAPRPAPTEAPAERFSDSV